MRIAIMAVAPVFLARLQVRSFPAVPLTCVPVALSIQRKPDCHAFRIPRPSSGRQRRLDRPRLSLHRLHKVLRRWLIWVHVEHWSARDRDANFDFGASAHRCDIISDTASCIGYRDNSARRIERQVPAKKCEGQSGLQ